MIPPVEENLESIHELCRELGVERLDLVGSATRETDWDPAHSDIDFLVRWRSDRPSLFTYFDFIEGLRARTAYRVDVVQEFAVKNSSSLVLFTRDRKPVYAS